MLCYECLQSVITVVEFSRHNALIGFNLSDCWKRMCSVLQLVLFSDTFKELVQPRKLENKIAH